MINDILKLVELIFVNIALLLPLANPLASMTMLISLGKDIPTEELKNQVRQATLYVIGIMIISHYAGSLILETLDISISGLKVAGGIIVSSIGFGMLFPKNHSEKTLVEDNENEKIIPNISFIPLAMPGTAGPGTIAMIITNASNASIQEYPEWINHLLPISVFSILGLIFWICLNSAGKIISMIGTNGLNAIARIIGFLLFCIGIQFTINGFLEITI